MNPSPPGRAHETKDDACRAQRAGRPYPQQIPSGLREGKAEDFGFIAASGYHEKSAIQVLNQASIAKQSQTRRRGSLCDEAASHHAEAARALAASSKPQK
jgi:hypothetical protein